MTISGGNVHIDTTRSLLSFLGELEDEDEDNTYPLCSLLVLECILVVKNEFVVLGPLVFWAMDFY